MKIKNWIKHFKRCVLIINIKKYLKVNIYSASVLGGVNSIGHGSMFPRFYKRLRMWDFEQKNIASKKLIKLHQWWIQRGRGQWRQPSPIGS